MRTWLAVLALSFCPLVGASQLQQPALPEKAPASPLPVDPDYRVGTGDVIDIAVFGNEDLSRSATIETNGTITFPLLGEVKVAGLSVAEVKNKLTTLLAKDYLVNPQVDVKVREFQSQFVIVVGELNNPGRKPLRGRTRLIDVLVDCGGFTPRASGDVEINRTDGTFEGGKKAIRMHLGSAAMTPQDEVDLAVILRNGDIITASPKYYVTVEGEVNKPGRFVLEGELTVSGAISTAGGLTRFGSGDVKLRRVDPQTGKITIVEVDLKAVRRGKAPDPALLPNDVVTVARRLF
jgi:polysaccharide export outer membrane protein